jgi:hypothetical protein
MKLLNGKKKKESCKPLINTIPASGYNSVSDSSAGFRKGDAVHTRTFAEKYPDITEGWEVEVSKAKGLGQLVQKLNCARKDRSESMLLKVLPADPAQPKPKSSWRVRFQQPRPEEEEEPEEELPSRAVLITVKEGDNVDFYTPIGHFGSTPVRQNSLPARLSPAMKSKENKYQPQRRVSIGHEEEIRVNRRHCPQSKQRALMDEESNSQMTGFTTNTEARSYATGYTTDATEDDSEESEDGSTVLGRNYPLRPLVNNGRRKLAPGELPAGTTLMRGVVEDLGVVAKFLLADGTACFQCVQETTREAVAETVADYRHRR